MFSSKLDHIYQRVPTNGTHFSKNMSLILENIHITVNNKEIIKGVNLEMKLGEIHAILGPNGSGKSTLANAIMGHPKYTITNGNLSMNDLDLITMPVDERARMGLFLSMQHLPDIDGVTVSNFIRTCLNARSEKKTNPLKFHQALQEKMQELGIDPSFANRSLNVGFSGGEKKRMEILQLEMLDPSYAILDETDSGIDVDALRFVADSLKRFTASGDKCVVLITHYTKLLEYLQPTHVHIMKSGTILKSGGVELVTEVEKRGFDGV
jgi:Fe-S cluster assembly ATP-binding protein